MKNRLFYHSRASENPEIWIPACAEMTYLSEQLLIGAIKYLQLTRLS